MIETIGWTGNILFAVCGIPQAAKTWRTKRAEDLSALFLWLWLTAEVLTFFYIVALDLQTRTFHFPLYFNYSFNTILASYLLYAKYFYKAPANRKGN